MSFIFIFSPSLLLAQLTQKYNPHNIKAPDVIHWRLSAATEAPDGKIKVIATLQTERDFTLYKEKTTVTNDQGYQLENITDPGTQQILDPVTKKMTHVYSEGNFIFVFAKKNNSIPTPKDFNVAIRYIACTTKICLFPYTENLSIQLVENSSGDGIATTDSGTEDAHEDFESRLANRLKNADSFWIILLLVFAGGVLTNLTPCVFPMIPITMRILSKQHKSAYKSSMAYAGGILVTYSLLGIAAASTGGFFGAMFANKWFNLFFAIMMFLFGLTMLGFGNFSALQSLGDKFGSGKNSLKNAFMMGAGAGLVAAPCTGPILALLLAITAQSGEFARGSFLMFIYSFGFALPYVFLGKASASVSQIKAPPQVQLGVKMLFTGVMFALGFYYLRIPLYSFLESMNELWKPLFLGTLPLGAIALLITLKNPKFHTNKYAQIIPPLLLALGLFGLIRSHYHESKRTSLIWYKTETEAFAAASSENKPILIDNWAEWCEACKKMDVTTFTEPEVIEELQKNWVILKLDLTESNDANDAIMAKYSLAGLPTMVLLPASADIKQKELIAGYVNGAALLNRLDKFAKQKR